MNLDFSDPLWIKHNLPKLQDVSSATLATLDDAGGLASKMLRLTITNTSGSTTSFVVKTCGNLERSKSLCLAREALFYNSLASRLPLKSVPYVAFSQGNLDSGEKLIIMENLSHSNHVQAGYFFGNCSPHNWAKDLPAITGIKDESERKQVTQRITRLAFRKAALFHATWWNDHSLLLLEFSWLRGADWFHGNGEADWIRHQETAFSAWRVEKSKIETGTTNVRWDKRLVAVMDASFSKISWANFQTRIRSTPMSLVHGDYHPANMMFRLSADNDDQDSLLLLDWEVVGLGSGPQECSQFLISHMYPQERRECEESLLREYYSAFLDHLKFTVAATADTGRANEDNGLPLAYSFEDCKKEYVTGGVARWVWLLGILTSMCPDAWNQFFHDQLLAFVVDHGVTAENVEMPRV